MDRLLIQRNVKGSSISICDRSFDMQNNRNLSGNFVIHILAHTSVDTGYGFRES